MDFSVLSIKSFFAGLIALIAGALGGSDAILDLLITLIICDVVTGLLNAFIHKELSSTVMRNGFTHKILIFVMVVVAVRADNAIQVYFDKDFHIRVFVIAFFCLEELISLLENAANAGVPIPKWLRAALKKVSNEVNTTAPRFIVDTIKKLLKIDISKDSSTENSELKDTSSSSVGTSDDNSNSDDSVTETQENK